MLSVPASERPGLMTADGQLSQTGLTRIRNAVFQRAYGDPDLVAMLAESTDANMKNVLGAMLRSAPEMAKMRELVDAGARHPTTLPEDIAQASRLFSQLRAEGMTVDKFFAQGQMFDDGVSPNIARMIQMLDEHSRAPVRLAAAIQEEIDVVHGFGNPRQGGLFDDGAKPLTPLEFAAQRFVADNPDLLIRIGTTNNGEAITTTPRQMMDEANAGAAKMLDDVPLYEAAAACLLGRGR
jgi:hypothetical protein